MASVATTDEILLRFEVGSEQRRFRRSIESQGIRSDVIEKRPAPPTPIAAHIPVVTSAEVPGFVNGKLVGLAHANVVISRNAISDLGSDVKSLVGGNLGGMESALDRAVRQAVERLQSDCARLGGDAVISMTVAIASVSDKAQAIIMAGTAVMLETRRSNDQATASDSD